jgi:hypothetical protein
MSAANKAGATSLTQNSENFGYSRVRLRRIAKLQFGIINPNELVRNAVYVMLHTISCVGCCYRRRQRRREEGCERSLSAMSLSLCDLLLLVMVLRCYLVLMHVMQWSGLEW